MDRTNELIICKDKYETKEDFENAIKDAVMVLLNNDYIMTVRYDEKGLGIVAIEYNNDDANYGTAYPEWLYPEEFQSIVWEGKD